MSDHRHCLRCNKKVAVKSPHWELSSRGQPLLKGTCSVCGGKISTIVSSADVPENVRQRAAAFKKSHPAKSRKSKSKSRKSKSGSRERKSAKRASRK